MALSMMMLFACAPMSKESYLERYQNFIDEIAAEHSDYSESDWEDIEERYQKFSEEWYRKFEDEFTFKEKIRLTKYEVQYNAWKTKSGLENFFESFLEEDYEDLKEEVETYAENDMHEDIEQLMQSAKVAGDTAVKMMAEILEELDIDPNTLERNN